MDFLEKDLETIIFENFHKLKDRGLDVYGTTSKTLTTRQLNLGAYGIYDLLLITVKSYNGDRFINIHVVECKLNMIDQRAYFQAKRYVTAIKRILTYFNIDNTSFNIYTVLIGKSIDTSSDFVFGLNDDENTSCFTYKYDIDGIKFTKHTEEWVKTNEKLDKIVSEIPSYIWSFARKVGLGDTLTKKETTKTPF